MRTSILRPISGIRCVLRYALENLDGALDIPLLAESALEKLQLAANLVASKSTADKQLELVVWDAYRTLATQQAIFDRYKQSIMSEQPGITEDETEKRAREFVSHPSTTFPHGTGGAVDVTISVNNVLADMGTDFDAFVEASSPDWYLNNAPNTKRDKEAAEHREILRSAMEAAGFVGISTEWWHFEWGTSRWSETSNQAAILDVVLSCQINSNCPSRQPVWESGVAQAFPSAKARRDALLHQGPGHYYARTSQPSTERLATQLQKLLPGACGVVLTPNGLSACISTFQGLIPEGGSVLYDNKIYYEVERALLMLAPSRGWHMHKADFSNIAELQSALERLTTIDLLYCESPRNWWLESLDLQRISQLAQEWQITLAIDTSVQPLQSDIGLGAVSIVSLSKYPSMGLTTGGAVLCRRPEHHAVILETSRRLAYNMAPETAALISGTAISLRDRMFALSCKAEAIKEHLQRLPYVQQVRLPNKELSGGLCGGQLAFQLDSYSDGSMLEEVIGHNSLSETTSVVLACTFGAAFTTLEHFASNRRARTGISWDSTNESEIPRNLVRIGIGCESLEDIWRDLEFALEAVATMNRL